MAYDFIHIVHIFAVFTYGGFLFTDNLFMSKMQQSLDPQEYKKAREAIMMHVRKVVPNALLLAVATGIFLAANIFGEIKDGTLSNFQILLSIKIFLGLWLGFRGFNQKFFGIDPWVFKSHLFPFGLVIIMILLSQVMFLV
jgi:hypothetical protein